MRQTFLAIDDVSLPWRKNVCLYLEKPTVRLEPVLAPSPVESNAPDNLAAHFYGTVLHDQGVFRMWYYACHRGLNPDWSTHQQQQLAKNPGWLLGKQEGFQVYEGPICYAESDDGIIWRKPELGQVLFKGNRANNALDLPHALICGVAVLRDDEDPDPAQRYKMVYEFMPDQSDPPIAAYGCRPTMACAVSPDGIRWRMTAIPFPNQFIEQSSFIRHQGQYIVHYQVMDSWAGWLAEGGTPCGRTGVARVTYDWDLWPDLTATTYALPEPTDPHLRGMDGAYDQVHLGVGAASFGNVCVGVYGLWHNAAFGENFGHISGDLGLVVSNDGIHFREPGATPGRVFIHRNDSPATPVPGQAFNTILCQGNGILNVGGETRIYHGRWRNCGQHAEDIASYYRGEVALATLPRDRWGALALHPDAGEGSFCTAQITLPADGGTITVNAVGVASLSVDLLDEQFRPIPGMPGGTVKGSDGLECPVIWQKHVLNDLESKMVRIHITLRRNGQVDPRVYALYVT